jgi:cation diffusion facilitator family transporter
MSEQKEINALRLTVAAYILVFGLKLTAFFFTGVMSVLAEAFHTLSDIFISAFLLIASRVSRKKADDLHMFGYGRAQNIAALVAATLFVSFTSFKLFEEAIPRLFNSHEAVYGNLGVAIAVLAVSIVIAMLPLISFLRQKEKGPAARAQFLELINDQLGLIAALCGTVFVMLGMPLADPIATLIVALIIAVNAIRLFRENSSFLLGRSPGAQYLETIRQCAMNVAGVIDIHELRAEYTSADSIHVELHIRVDRHTTVEDAHKIVVELRHRAETAVKNSLFTIHVDPDTEGGDS